MKSFGMIYTSQCLNIPGTHIKVTEIYRPDLCNFDTALNELSNIIPCPLNLNMCLNTVVTGFDILEAENQLSQSKKSKFQECCQFQAMIIQSLKKEEKCVIVPSKSNPICDPEAKRSMNTFAQCLAFSGLKAPGIELFPGDFMKVPKLLRNVQIYLKTRWAGLLLY